MGGARLLPAGSRAVRIAHELKGLVIANWWHRVSHFDLPAVLVGPEPELRIIRANAVARDDFNPVLVGKSYADAIEYRENGAKLPVRHPLLECWRNAGSPLPRDVSDYYEYQDRDGRTCRCFMVCTPVVGLRSEVRAVAVLLIRLDSLTLIQEANQKFLNCTREALLHGEIVEHARLLGFRRARLYRYDTEHGGTPRFRGVKTSGYSKEDADVFQTVSVDAENDRPSKVIFERRFPTLFVRETSANGDGGHRAIEVIEQHAPDPRLRMGHVDRWIEAPLLIPDESLDRGQRFWGKLCVDLDEESGKLTPRHLRDIAMFAIWASMAIREFDGRHDVQFQRLLSGLREKIFHAPWYRPDAFILKNVRRCLADLTQQVSGADCVSYAEFRNGEFVIESSEENSPRSLEPLNSSVDVQDYLKDVDRVGTLEDGVTFRPYISSDRHELTLPITASGHLRGVFVAKSQQGFVVPPSVLTECMIVASFWIEFSELHDAKLAWAESLQNLVQQLPELAKSEDATRFYAGLATVLTAEGGLGWNRAIVFLADTPRRGIAKLIYAVGGQGEPEHTDSWEKLRARSLRELVAERIQNPEPDGPDSLHKAYCAGVAEPLEIGYGMESESTAPHKFYVRGNAFEVLTLTAQTAQKEGVPIGMHVDLRQERFFQQLQKEFPGLIVTDSMFVFPIWQEFSGSRPLAFILVDNPYAPPNPAFLAERRSITRIVLDLASELLAVRNQVPLVRNLLGNLAAFRHEGELQSFWPHLKSHTNELIRRLYPEGRPAPIASVAALDDLKLIKRTDHALLILDRKVNAIGQAQKVVEQALKLNTRENDISRVPLLNLDAWARAFCGPRRSKVYRRTFVRGAAGLDAAIRRETLDDVADLIASNAVDAVVNAYGRNREPEIFIQLREEGSRSEEFRCFAAIDIIDNGPGIDPIDVPHLFIDGYTGQRNHGESDDGDSHVARGRGLAIARAQLWLSAGDVCVENPRSSPHPLRPSEFLGATFTIRIGIR